MKEFKILHIADTHIRNQKFHAEYKQVFEEIYRIATLKQPDIIVHCGDLAHTKTQISPEYVDLCASFLKNLSNIAPTYVLAGNHDGNLKNLERMDAITPIVEFLSEPKLYFDRKSVKYEINKDIDLYTWSLFDKGNWQTQPKFPHKINICLYHGAIKNVSTDVGYIIQHGDVEPENFVAFDYVLLGDIHKTNQVVSNLGHIRYAGSTIQQNFGEEDDKGMLLWTIRGKNDYDVEVITIKHPCPFVSIEVSTDSIFVPLDIPRNSKIRLVTKNRFSADETRKMLDFYSEKYHPQFITVVNDSSPILHSFEDSENRNNRDVRDIQVQNELLEEFSRNHTQNPEIVAKVLEINRELEEKLASEYHSIGKNWKLLEMKWDNLFNYGPNNSINFNPLRGIVGVFGQNYSGKSSIFDTLLLGLFNSDAKPPRKNVFYINENKENASVTIKLGLDGGRIATIRREYEKYVKKVKKVKSVESKTKIEFLVENADGSIAVESEEGKYSIDAQIQEFIGTLEHFLMSSMVSQQNSSIFIDLGSTKRKQMLANFLDLGMFEKKFSLGKEEKKMLERELKNFSRVEGEKYTGGYQFLIESKKDEANTNRKLISEQREQCQKLKASIEEEKVRLRTLEGQKPTEEPIFNIEQIRQQLESVCKEMNNCRTEYEEMKKIQEDKETYGQTIEELLSEIDIRELEEDKHKTSSLKQTINGLENKIRQDEANYKNHVKRTTLLQEVPCGDMFPQCKFIRDAWESKEIAANLEENIRFLSSQLSEHLSKYNREESEALETYIKTHQEYTKKKLLNDNEILKISSQIFRVQTRCEELTNKKNKLETIVKKYEQNREYYANQKKIQEEIRDCQYNINNLTDELIKCESRLERYLIDRGKVEKELETLKQEQEKYEETLLTYSAYDIYSKACHANGIPCDIIKEKLEIVNHEINKILSKVVDFKIMLETEEEKMNIYIQHPNYSTRPIEGASGAEKAFASLAIRLALLNISNLPKSNIFILDEPGTSFDEHNLESFTRMLSVIKEQFDIVFLISHMDTLKDVSDVILDIENVDGFAKVVI